jgi:hypothetical protein
MPTSGFRRVVAVVTVGGILYLAVRQESHHEPEALPAQAAVPSDHPHVPEGAPAGQEWLRPAGTISGSTATPTPSPYYGFSTIKA